MQKKNFNLDRSFYSREVIGAACEAFSQFAITITDEGVSISDENAQTIFDEFSNYCLLLTNEGTV